MKNMKRRRFILQKMDYIPFCENELRAVLTFW